MSHPFAEYWRWHTGYRISRDIIQPPQRLATPDLVAQKGATITSSIGASLTRDSRDVIAAPTKGAQTTPRSTSPGLGGDSQFLQGDLPPDLLQTDLARPHLGMRGEAGYEAGWGGKEVPLVRALYLGGPNTIALQIPQRFLL